MVVILPRQSELDAVARLLEGSGGDGWVERREERFLTSVDTVEALLEAGAIREELEEALETWLDEGMDHPTGQPSYLHIGGVWVCPPFADEEEERV